MKPIKFQAIIKLICCFRFYLNNRKGSNRNILIHINVAASSSSPRAAVTAAIKSCLVQTQSFLTDSWIISIVNICTSDCLITYSMEDGGVDTTVIVSWQHKPDQMADNSLLLAYVVYALLKHIDESSWHNFI